MQLCILQTYSLPALQSSILSYAQKPEVYYLWSELSLTSFSEFDILQITNLRFLY